MIRTSILWVSVTDRRKWVLKMCGYKFTSDWKQLHDLHISKRFMQNRPRFTSWKLLSLWQTQSVSLVTVGMVGMVGKYYEIIQNRTEGWKRWLKLGPCNQGTERIESCDLPWRRHIWRSLDNILGRSQRRREQDFLGIERANHTLKLQSGIWKTAWRKTILPCNNPLKPCIWRIWNCQLRHIVMTRI